MRKIVLASCRVGSDGVCAGGECRRADKFCGHLGLDKAKSQGLSPRLQGADSVSWVITQTDKTISLDQKVTGGQPPAGGPPAGGPPAGGPPGGGGGRGPGMGGPQSYNLDGSESASENGAAKSTRKATWSSDGKTLELSANTTFTGQDGTERKSSSTDKLTLSADGKVLTSSSHREGGRGGPQDSTLVFNKQ